MTALLILLAIVLIALLAPWFGTDSRDLARGERSRDALWSRQGPGRARLL